MGDKLQGLKTDRPGLLWVCRDRPTRHGSGSQQRAAHVLLGLADHFDLHVVVFTPGPSLAGGHDQDLFASFASYERISGEELAEDTAAVPDGGRSVAGVAIDDAPARLVEMRRQRGVVGTMIVTFELAVFLRSVLDQLQPVHLELDEVMSRRQERFLATPELSSDKRAEYERGMRLMRMLERQVLPGFRGVIVSSELERANVRGLVPDEIVSIVPNATHRDAVLPPPSSQKPHTIMFVGRMDYFPNIDAMRYFLREVWPLLRAGLGDDVRFHIVGGGAPESFQVDDIAGVTLDRNRADVLPVYRQASIAVVPIRSGGGTRVKIIEAFALGRAVVSTTIGAEGLGAEPGRHLLIADTPEEFAGACARLIGEPQLAARLAAEAADWVRSRYSPAAVRRAVAESVIVRALRS